MDEMLANIHLNDDLNPERSWSYIASRCIPLVENVISKYFQNKKVVEVLVVKAVYKVIELEFFDHFLENWPEKSKTKDNNKSALWRNHGNVFFKEKNWDLCKKFYCDSILYATEGSPELALAYSNRSAVFYEECRYKLAQIDIRRCLQNPYPDNLKFKVYFRLANCCKELNDIEGATNALTKAKDFFPKCKLAPKQRAEIGKNLTEFEESLINHKENVLKPDYEKVKFELAYGENTTFYSASAALDLRMDGKRGRYVVANKKLKRGDVLFIEEPYVFVVDSQLTTNAVFRIYKLCISCMIPIYGSMVPCKTCINMHYCSEECRQKTWDAYHQWECAGMMSGFLHTIGIGSLALRVVLKASNTGFKTKVNTDNVFKCRENTYPAVYNLLTHIENMSHEDVVMYGLTAVMITRYLEKQTNFFSGLMKKGTYKSERQAKYFIASLILRHLCQMQCNAHKMRIKGAGIYPATSMMNHSCDTNITNSFNGTTLIVRAYRDIEEGEEIFNSYGVHYTKHSWEDRQNKLLKQYYFKCECKPCTDLSLRYYYELFNAFMCPKCNGRELNKYSKGYVCYDCGFTEVRRASDVLRSMTALGDTDGINYEAVLEMYQDHLHPDNMLMRKANLKMANFKAKQQHWEEAIEIWKGVLESLKKQYGPYSFEVVEEMASISKAMVDYLQILETEHSMKLRYYSSEVLSFLNETKEKLMLYSVPDNNYNILDFCIDDLIEKVEVIIQLKVNNIFVN